jgi:ribonuclease J
MTIPFDMRPDALYFLPLGGCGIFGANMTLYGYRGKWLMADCGMGFADDTMPGIDILLPNPAFAQALGENLLGIVLTHAHEDHIGAIPSLWPRLRAPLFATKFTAARIRQALSEMPWGGEATLRETVPGKSVKLGPFAVDFVRMAHSIPEANALAITAEGLGTVVHTGDWKLDRDPVEGNVTDEAALKELGARGVLAVTGDSTNAMVPGNSGSERTVQGNLIELFGEFKNRIAITCFATNVARLASIAEAAQRNDRQVCLLGRSLWGVDEAARKTGYLKNLPPFLDEDSAAAIPPKHLVYVCTGSQGESRAALARIANDDHPALRLSENDVMIFSSRAIPGNERAIDRIRNRLLLKGVNVITDRDAPVHVSGHPYREELKALYGWLKPKIVFAVHGEQMQQEKHAELARDCGVAQALTPVNGQVFEVTAAGAKLVHEVESGMLAIEGKRIVAVDHEAILARRRLMYNGSVVVTVVVDKKGVLIAAPRVTALGLLDENSELDDEYVRDVVKDIAARISELDEKTRADDAGLSELVRVTARRFFSEHFDRRPQTRVHLIRL